MSAERELPDLELTLRDIAILADRLGELPAGTCDRLARQIGADPRCEPWIRELETMAADARLAPDVKARLNTALTAHQEFDQLVATRGWRHAAEVLDPTGEIGVDFAPLIAIAEARARQSDDASRLHSVRQRLERDYAAEQAEDALIESFVDGLLAREPEAASRLFKLARAQYRQRTRERRPVAAPVHS